MCDSIKAGSVSHQFEFSSPESDPRNACWRLSGEDNADPRDKRLSVIPRLLSHCDCDGTRCSPSPCVHLGRSCPHSARRCSVEMVIVAVSVGASESFIKIRIDLN